MKELEKPIIFIGTGRSGTTIISELIMHHKNVAYTSNYQDMFFKYPMINSIRFLFDNPFYRILGKKKQLNKVNRFNKYLFKPAENYKMWNYLVGESINFSRDFLLDTKLDNKRIEFIRDYFKKMVRYQGKNRLAFKITGPSRINFLLQIFPDAHFVVLKRSLIPTISSFLKVDFWKSRGYSKLWWFGAYSNEEKEWAKNNSENSIKLTAFQLKKIETIIYRELSESKPKFIEVNYEDFVKEPKTIVSNILSFLELEKNNSSVYNNLSKTKIINRNKKDSEYFSKEELIQIREIIN